MTRLKSPVRVLLLALLLGLGPVTPAPVLAEGPNLLQNPGFEQPFVASIPGKENCLLAAPWEAWFVEGSPEETSKGYKLAPEYKLATRADYPGNRVRNGELSQQYFHSFGNFIAGVFQTVHNVTPGARYKAEMWIMSWSCGDEHKADCAGATSDWASPMHLRLGIDPTGGRDPFNPAIVWSPEQNAYDDWHLFEVEATAQSSAITVFVYSYPDYRSQDNNVYLDDASLVKLGPPPPPTPLPTNPPTVPPPPTNTPPATATPPPTDTPLPTDTPAATPTLLPTDTPPPTVAPTTAAPADTAVPAAPPEPSPRGLLSGPGLLLSLAGLVLIAGLSIGIVMARRRR